MIHEHQFNRQDVNGEALDTSRLHRIGCHYEAIIKKKHVLLMVCFFFLFKDIF